MPARRRLDRGDLVTTALALVDQDGMAGLSIRRVAERHGASPMALYRYFPDKNGLDDAIAERLLSEVGLPEADGRAWYEQLRDLLEEVLAALRRHPHAVELVFTRILTSEPGLALAERVLALLADAGLSVERAAETGTQALCSLAALVLAEPGRAESREDEDSEAAARLKRASLLALSPRRYPHVVAAADALASCSSEDVFYRRGVDMIITGIRGMDPDPAPAAPASTGP
jgi:AcrR family transcriptional regulator